jgi:hypothetical protein
MASTLSTSTEGAVRRYAQHRSRVPAGNLRQGIDGRLLKTGGEERARFTTTLPPSTLRALDALVAMANVTAGTALQRNEALALLVATVAGDHHEPAARQRFLALAASWKGWGEGLQPPAGAAPARKRPCTPGKLGADALQQIADHLAQGDAAPRGWRAALARAHGVTAGAITRAAQRLEQAG